MTEDITTKFQSDRDLSTYPKATDIDINSNTVNIDRNVAPGCCY